MPRITEYGARPATLRRELTQDLAKALAHYRARHPDKASAWAEKLIMRLITARILDREQARQAAARKR